MLADTSKADTLPARPAVAPRTRDNGSRHLPLKIWVSASLARGTSRRDSAIKVMRVHQKLIETQWVVRPLWFVSITCIALTSSERGVKLRLFRLSAPVYTLLSVTLPGALAWLI